MGFPAQFADYDAFIRTLGSSFSLSVSRVIIISLTRNGQEGMIFLMGLDVLGVRLGILGVILALFSIAAFYLWPEKKWIGWTCLIFASFLLLAWVTAELKATQFLGALSLPATILLGAAIGAGIAYLLWVKTPQSVPTTQSTPSKPQMEIGLALGADKGIGVDSIVDCSKPPYRCLNESQIVGSILPLDLGSKNWARLIFRLKNVGETKLVNSSIHIESPSAVSIDYAPAPNPNRLPRNVLDLPSGGMEIQPFSISKGEYAVPIDVIVPLGLNDLEINVKVFGDNMAAHELRAEFTVIRREPSIPVANPAQAKPDITANIVNPTSIALEYMNNGNGIAKDIRSLVMIWDLDNLPADDLPLPKANILTEDLYLQPKTYSMPFPIASDPINKPSIKTGDRLFGIYTATCGDCINNRGYWIYAVAGKGGWYSPWEENRHPQPSDLLKKIRHIATNTDEFLDLCVPDRTKRLPIKEQSF